MTDAGNQLERLRRAAKVIQGLQQRLAEAEKRAAEPIAIVGLSCRFPGQANTPESYWQLLLEGRDAIAPIGAERWDQEAVFDPNPEALGKSYARHMGALKDVDCFDADLFGISSREAESMDPQQRMLLEQTWHALEHAGIAPTCLRGSQTGVFVGTGPSDFAARLFQNSRSSIDAFSATGSTACVAAGRISYVYGLEGPSMVVDTACSSSLLAVHLACRSLERGEIDLALAGGVSAILAPEPIIAMCRNRALSPSGACRAFDDAADGYVRSEGCGMIVLKRLSDARAAQDRVLAIVRGGASSHDGRSNGLTAPNGASQVKVIRSALRDAQLAPHEVDFIEAHGTGTPLGDPIELHALQEVFGGQTPRERPLWVSSVKANLGHLESAGGIAGLIKAVLSLQHEVSPPQPHFSRPNRNFEWGGSVLAVPTKPVSLSAQGRPLRAGISSFGFSGTNVHLILEQVPAPASQGAALESVEPVLLALSAKTPEGVRAQASALADLLEREQGRAALHGSASLRGIASALWHRRARLEARTALVASSTRDALSALRAVASDLPGAQPIRAAHSSEPTKFAFLFSGQGAQYPGMGRELFEAYPAFRETLLRCDQALRAELEGSLVAALYGGDDAPRRALSDTALTQPALFSLQMALVELWRSLGVRPAVVLGHSIGELAAACTAGVFSLEDGLRFAATRGRLMADHCAPGAMAALQCDEPTAMSLLSGEDVAIAALNAADETVVAGSAESVERVCARAAERGLKARRLDVSHAFHSPMMEPALRPLRAELERLRLHPPSLPIYSNVRGALGGTELATPEYWVRHARDAVRFAPSLRALAAQKPGALLEIGPQGTLLALAAKAEVPAAVAVASLRKGKADRQVLLHALGQLWTSGAPLHDELVERTPEHVELPVYPFQRRRFWPTDRSKSSAPQPMRSSPGARHVASAGRESTYEQVHSAQGYIGDHRLSGRVVVPGAAHLVFAEASARALAGAGAVVEDVSFDLPWVLEDQPAISQLVAAPASADGVRPFTIYRLLPASSEAAPQYRAHVSGRVRAGAEGAPARSFVPPTGPPTHRAADLYREVAARGLQFGPRFQCVKQIWATDDVVTAELELPPGLDAESAEVAIHPVLIDGGFQAVAALGGLSHAREDLFVPAGVRRFAVTGAARGRAWVVATLKPESSQETIRIDLAWYDQHGRAVAELGELGLRRARKTERELGGNFERLIQRVEYRPSALSAPRDRQSVRHVCFRGSRSACAPILAALEARGGHGAWAATGVDAAAQGDTMVFVAAEELSSQEQLLKVAEELLDAQRRHRSVRLFIVTFEACAATAVDRVSPHSAALLGLARALAWERAPQPTIHIDVARRGPWVQALLDELLADASEDLVVLREGQRYVARLTNRSNADAKLTLPSSENWVLKKGSDGLLDSLCVVPESRRVPGPGEIEVAITASGVNFRDVLHALGMMGHGGTIGWECAGVVSRVGPGVSLLVGDRVFGLAPEAYARFVTVDARWFALTPPMLTDVRAATLPMAFLTAMYGLDTLAGLQAGQSVLIHAAAGGVGMAALQVARARGARVFATASPWKWPLLEELGVEAPLSSRDGSFAEQILERTDGRGVDVVLNGLTGPLLAKSVSVLAPGGLFLELGKLELLSDDDPGLRARNARYRAFDLSELRPDQAHVLFDRLVAGISQGSYRPLPLRTFPIRKAQAAFRFVAQAQHVGKVVLVPPHPLDESREVRADGTYVISGAFGALGRVFARWLAEQGAGALVLLGRRLPPELAGEVESLRARGTRVLPIAVDIADEGALRAALEELRPTLPPIRGVLHAAGVLSDKLVEKLTQEDFRRVLTPKVAGTECLHRATLRDPLDWFVLCSSTASILGSVGQANYSLANAFMDAFAHARRREGLPACSIHWGPWADVGMAARVHDATRKRWRELGFEPLQPVEGCAALQHALRNDDTELAVLSLDPQRMQRALGRLPALLADYASTVSEAENAPAVAWADQLARLPSGRRKSWLTEELLALIRRTLSVGSELAIAPSDSLQSLGLDSLMAVELRNAITRATGRDLSPTLLFDYPTLDALSGHLLQAMLPAERPRSTPTFVEDTARAGELDELDGDFGALMRDELAAVRELLGQDGT